MATVRRENLRRLFMYIDKLPTVIPESVFDAYDSHVKWRRAHQPIVYGCASSSAEPWASSAVCFFKRLAAACWMLMRLIYIGTYVSRTRSIILCGVLSYRGLGQPDPTSVGYHGYGKQTVVFIWAFAFIWWLFWCVFLVHDWIDVCSCQLRKSGGYYPAIALCCFSGQSKAGLQSSLCKIILLKYISVRFMGYFFEKWHYWLIGRVNGSRTLNLAGKPGRVISVRSN